MALYTSNLQVAYPVRYDSLNQGQECEPRMMSLRSPSDLYRMIHLNAVNTLPMGKLQSGGLHQRLTSL